MSSIEYGITHEVANEDGTKMWIKAGLSLDTKGVAPTQKEWDYLVDETNAQALKAIARTAAQLAQLNG